MTLICQMFPKFFVKKLFSSMRHCSCHNIFGIFLHFLGYVHCSLFTPEIASCSTQYHRWHFVNSKTWASDRIKQFLMHAWFQREKKPLISFPKLSGVFMPYGLLSCLWPRGPDRECRAKIQRKSFRQTTPSYKQPQSNIVEHIKPPTQKNLLDLKTWLRKTYFWDAFTNSISSLPTFIFLHPTIFSYSSNTAPLKQILF